MRRACVCVCVRAWVRVWVGACVRVCVRMISPHVWCVILPRVTLMHRVRPYCMVFGPRQPSEGAYAIVTGVFLKQHEQGRGAPYPSPPLFSCST